MLDNHHDNEERKRRQKMRVYPAMAPVGTRSPDTAVAQRREGGNGGGKNELSAEKRRYEDARRKAIVSIYGRDLSSEDQIAETHARDAEAARNRSRKKHAA